MKGWCHAGLALSLGVFLLYHFSFSSVPTSDGYTFTSNIEQSDYPGMLIANWPLSSYFFFLLHRLLSMLGLPIPTLSLIQTVNGAVAALGAFLLYGVIRLLGGGTLLGILGGALLATSFGYWYFANGELHHLSLGVLILIFSLLLRTRMTGRPYGYGFVIGLGLLNAVAVLLHQENFLFGFTALALLLVGRPWRQGVKEGLVYAVAGSLGTAALVLAVGLFLRGVSSPQEFVRWYFWRLIEYAEHPQEYQEFEFVGLPFVGPRVLKGQLTALVFGTQAVADAMREPALLGYSTVGYLLGLTVLAYGLVALLLAELWRTRRLIRERYLIPLIGCAVWLLSYKVLLHSWFWPTSTEYHVVTLPPLILLLLLGPIAARAETRPVPRRPVLRAGSVAALLVVVFVINFWGGILPWYRYGQMKEVLTAQLATTFRPDDFFISTESGIDSVFHKGGNYLSVKDLFNGTSKTEGFEFIRASITEHLMSGRRVFIYNFVPNPFTLIGLNQVARHRGGDQFSYRDFEKFLAELRESYVLIPVLSYWEEGKEPLYLYGARLQTLWEVTQGSAG